MLNYLTNNSEDIAYDIVQDKLRFPYHIINKNKFQVG